MKVEVIKSSGGYWYSTRTGEQFDVTEKNDHMFFVTVGDDVRHIHEFHCKVVEDNITHPKTIDKSFKKGFIDIKIGDKVKMTVGSETDIDLTIGKYYECAEIGNNGIFIIDDIGQGNFLFNNQYEVTESKDAHYNNTNGSLYKFAADHDLNAFEFDAIKRLVRCRKKGQFIEDLEKTKRVIDLYIAEYDQSSIYSRCYGGSVKEEDKKDNR